MPVARYCAFCQMSGVAGPHDHFVRTTREPSSAVTCPLLLGTVCSFCDKKGHTAKYCGARAEAEVIAKTAFRDAKKLSLTKGGWTDPVKTKPKSARAQPAAKHTAGVFAALVCEISSDSEQDYDPKEDGGKMSWAAAVKNKNTVSKEEPMKIERKPVGKSWADWMEE